MTRFQIPCTTDEQNINLDNEITDCILLMDELKIEQASEIVKRLLEIEHRNNQTGQFDKIQFIINSPGGDLYSAWMICDIMDQMITPIETFGLGQVASAGIMIFMNGTKGLRKATLNTQFMSHRYSIGIQANHADLMSQRHELDRTHDRIVNHYIKCSGLSKSKIEKELLTEHNVWLDAAECKKLNILDIIVDNKIKGK